MTVHHNALCTPCIALVNCDCHLHKCWITQSRKRRSKRSKSKERSEVHKHQVVRILTYL
jgi:hypothetical protein